MVMIQFISISIVLSFFLISVWTIDITEGSYLQRSSALVRLLLNKKAPYPQFSNDQFNLLRLGGAFQPFISHLGFGIDPDVPDDCVVDQVHLLLRHGERFPSLLDGVQQRNMITDLKSVNVLNNTGPLLFLKDYQYFAQDSDFEQLSTTGVYSGAYDAFKQGIAFRKEYNHLYNDKQKLPIFTAGQKRVVDTAKNFAKGFLDDFDNMLLLQVLPETRDQGANTLTPSTYCTTYNRTINDYLILQFPKTYLEKAVTRLTTYSPDYLGKITTDYAYKMMSMCSFELNTLGESHWCDLFTKDEWLNFAYQRDLTFYYQSSHGHDKSMGIGSNYVNATLELLESEPQQKIFASFTHDTDITPVLAPLGLFTDNGVRLTTIQINFNSEFKASQIVPMGARLVIERLKSSLNDRHYVRVKVGGSVIPMDDCTSGPGFSCELNKFKSIIQKNLNGTNYVETCQLDSSLPQHLSFFWDWEVKNYTEAESIHLVLLQENSTSI